MSMADVFAGDAFSTVSLTSSINTLPYAPRRIGEIGLFAGEGITTTTVVLEENVGTLELLPSKPRGSNPSIGKPEKRKARSFVVPHIPHEDMVLASDVQNVREMGSEDQTQTVTTVVNNKLQKMRLNHEITEEHLRIGAIKGTILDADGSTLFDLFSEFGITQTTINMALTTTTTKVRSKGFDVLNAMEAALGAAGFTGIRAFCGQEFFKSLTEHSAVADAFARWESGRFLRDDVRGGFEFAGIVWEQYRGSVNGTAFVDTNTAHVVAEGVPDLFKTAYAPANFMETANTIGIPVYAKQKMADMDTGVRLHTQSNPLPLCTRPASLIKLTRS